MGEIGQGGEKERGARAVASPPPNNTPRLSRSHAPSPNVHHNHTLNHTSVPRDDELLPGHGGGEQPQAPALPKKRWRWRGQEGGGGGEGGVGVPRPPVVRRGRGRVGAAAAHEGACVRGRVCVCAFFFGGGGWCVVECEGGSFLLSPIPCGSVVSHTSPSKWGGGGPHAYILNRCRCGW